MDGSELDTWNYRLIKHKKDGKVYYSMHMVYYDYDEKPVYMNDEVVTIIGDNEEDIVEDVQVMLDAFEDEILDAKIFVKSKRMLN